MGSPTDVQPIGTVLAAAAATHGDKTALIVDETQVSFRELASRSHYVGKGLLGLGIGPGSRVGVLMANEPLALVTMLGAWSVGAIVVPINARYRTAELVHVVENADLDVVVTSDLVAQYSDYAARLQAAFPDLGTSPDPYNLALKAAPRLKSIVLHGSTTRPGFLTSAQFDAAASQVADGRVSEMADGLRPQDPCLIMYTSGTTAHPKGCVHSHAALVRNGDAMATCMRMEEHDVVWDPLPFFHIGGLIPFLGALNRGATYVTTVHFEAGTSLAALERSGATIAYVGFQTHINALLDHESFPTTDLSRLRYILAIGPEAFLRRVQREFPAAVQVSCYGSTEMGGIVTLHDIDDPPEQRAKTCGLPWPGIEIRAFDPVTGEICPPGIVGELRMRGYSQLLQYYKVAAPVADAEGWFASGDLGFVTEIGEVVYTGRLKDMLKIGGENVAASEVEFHLARHPAVSLAQVVGRPDDRLDEVAVAFVELKPGHSATPEELIAFCAEGLAPFKVPREVRFVTEWPMSTTKIQKFRLREQLLSESKQASNA